MTEPACTPSVEGRQERFADVELLRALLEQTHRYARESQTRVLGGLVELRMEQALLLLGRLTPRERGRE